MRWPSLPAGFGPLRPGEGLALTVLVVYLVTVGVTAGTAPPIDTDASNATGEAAHRGETLIGVQGPFARGGGRVVAMNGSGEITWQSPGTWAHFDVERLSDGRVLAAFVRRNASSCGSFVPPCPRTGFRVYDERGDRVLREWTYPVRYSHSSEVHDATMLPDGSVALVDMEYERLLVVDESGAITDEWNASSYYDAPADPTDSDWLHLNDVDYLGDDRFLVSVRNENQLLFVERGEGVTDVVNEDGDDDVLDHQHNPQYLGPGRILVADSDNDRVVELRENDSGRWNVAWQLGSAGNVSFHWPRDVDRLANGRLLVTDSHNGRVVEVDRNGTVYWSRETPQMPYEADRNGTEYPGGVGVRADDSSLPGGDDGTGPGEADLPLLSAAYEGFSGTVPVPYWFDRWLFAGLLVAVLALAGGAVSALRRRVG